LRVEATAAKQTAPSPPAAEAGGDRRCFRLRAAATTTRCSRLQRQQQQRLRP